MTKHSKIAKKDKISSIRLQARAKQQATVTAVGVDVGDQYTELCALDEEGEIVSQTRIRTTQEALQEHFREQRPLLVALETGTHSGWISRVIAACGHDVVVANARELRKIHQSDRKNDRADAEILARMVRYDRRLLAPTRPRSAQIQADTALLRAREAVVQARVRLINAARGLTKAAGGRLPGCTTDAFAKRTRTHIPSELQAALGPLFLVIEAVTEQIRHYDKRVEAMASEQYPKTTLLQQVAGVGPLTALGFMLTLGEEGRFARSRDVGAYLGPRPQARRIGPTVTPAANHQGRQHLPTAFVSRKRALYSWPVRTRLRFTPIWTAPLGTRWQERKAARNRCSRSEARDPLAQALAYRRGLRPHA